MSSLIPITLKGANLGERHRHLNSLVTEAYNAGEPFESIVMLTEWSPVDRLFKIDLAFKHKHVEYILKCLQDNDMLYVSRALKSKWLLDEEYRHIINPNYLEDILYPEMITTAVNKMKNWVYINMRDTDRCQEFYEYYSEKDSNYAIKLLSKCPAAIILNEFPKQFYLDEITPHRFKMLCEKNPLVAKTYLKLFKNKSLNRLSVKEYFNTLKFVLKTDADTVLDTIENHFLPHFKRLSKISTKYVITHHKDRFIQKPELYTARILNIDTLAQCLTQDECEELVIKLAQAQYLENEEHWFNYKNVEPFIKKLHVDKRSSFKKKIFVDKDIGKLVTDWPYTLPTPLFNVPKKATTDIFFDKEESPSEFDYMGDTLKCEKFLACRSANRFVLNNLGKPNLKTFLDSLFDEYRFTSFDKTLFELRKKIRSESKSQNRMYMMLVLVSKCGGIIKNFGALFHFLIEHRNEPCQVRAAVIRSLVKRAFVWRISDDIWNKFLVFGRGLGLDGDTPEADCVEGLHAVVMRTFLLNRELDTAVKTAYFKRFSTLACYSLTTTEKQHINNKLLNILHESANAEDNAYNAVKTLNYALDTLQSYHIKLESRPEIVTCIKNIMQKDQASVKSILKRMFHSKLGRKELFSENFIFIQTDASYLNALKHDVTVLSVEKFVKAVLSDKLNAEQFIRKMSIYFNQKEDLGNTFLTAFKEANIHKRLARPLVYLIGDNLKPYLLELDTTDVAIKLYSAVIRAHAHVARPAFSIDSLDWHESGVKFIANRVLKCKSVDVDRLIKRLLASKRTAKLAIVLSQRTNNQADVFAAVAKVRPTAALKTAHTYFRRQGDRSDLAIWDIIKPLIVKCKHTIVDNRQLLRRIKKVQWIPLSIRPEYAIETFKAINEIDFFKSMSVLCHIMILLPNIEGDFIEVVLCDFIQNRFTKMANGDNIYYGSGRTITLFFKLFSKYLLLCKTYDTQNERFQKVGQLYLNHLRSFWESIENKSKFFKYLNAIIDSFKYHKAFLNLNYVSCLPVMEKFEEWMQTFLPIEKYFGVYVPLRLTILYHKAIRQALEKMPDVFSDEIKRRNDAYILVGDNFGKNLAHEAQILTKKYFSSIVMLYELSVVDYVRAFNQGRFLIVPYIIKSIVDVSYGAECSLAIALYNANLTYIDEDKREEINKCLKEKDQIEMQFFYNNSGIHKPRRYH